MLDQRCQLLRILVCKSLHGCLIEHLPAEGPVQTQLAAVDPAIDTQPVCQRCLRALLITGAFPGWGEQRVVLAIETTVELAEVVEGDAWLGQLAQGSARLLVAQVTQGAEANAFVRDCPQLFLDMLDRLPRIGGRGQFQWEQAGKPADGTCQVDAVEQVFAAVAFQLYQH